MCDAHGARIVIDLVRVMFSSLKRRRRSACAHVTRRKPSGHLVVVSGKEHTASVFTVKLGVTFPLGGNLTATRLFDADYQVAIGGDGLMTDWIGAADVNIYELGHCSPPRAEEQTPCPTRPSACTRFGRGACNKRLHLWNIAEGSGWENQGVSKCLSKRTCYLFASEHDS